ncbi:hypothetical protein LZG04_37535 [Saccharothrix sp. S26]|uniref:hypothetical protein n=1 Tax=Saccharothrix sp. S26 TaxID=2907215 RepID=UPI001F1AE8C2|nr:hypothetical protein [Saccharothrix sp. S26]MCE7000481.1 hypothetical protein [Saccharothrix sp. S26]
MADHRGPMSEQQEALEPRWDAREGHGARPDPEAVGPQFTAPDEVVDEESTAIAEAAGSHYPVGPEDAAMHIEDDRSGD